MTIEQQIVDALKGYLQNISIAGGYSFDVGDNVFEWRESDLDAKRELPAIEIRDPLNEVDEDEPNKRLLTVEITLLMSGTTAPAKLREGVQDIITAISEIVNPNFVLDAQVAAIEKEVDIAEKRIARAQITLQVWYYAEMWKI